MRYFSVRSVLSSTPGAAVLAFAGVVLFQPGSPGNARYAAAQPDQVPVSAEAQIAKLPVCYALGTDAIGRGDIQEGKDIYKNCFTPDAVISVYFPRPSNDFSGPPDATSIGPDAWADYVASVFQGNGYTATQHLMGSINVSAVQGNSAKMTSYLLATHKRSETSIDVANGTYEDDVVRQNGQWKISHRVLKLLTFLNLQSPAPAP